MRTAHGPAPATISHALADAIPPSDDESCRSRANNSVYATASADRTMYTA
jgi:hypothetical protein